MSDSNVIARLTHDLLDTALNYGMSSPEYFTLIGTARHEFDLALVLHAMTAVNLQLLAAFQDEGVEPCDILDAFHRSTIDPEETFMHPNDPRWETGETFDFTSNWPEALS